MNSDINQALNTLGNPFKFKTVGGVASNLWGFLFSIGGLAAFIYLAIGGIKYLTAGGDKGKVEEAKQHLQQAVMGLAILAVSWAAALVIQKFVGLTILQSGSSGGGGGNLPSGCNCQYCEMVAGTTNQRRQCNGITSGGTCVWDQSGVCSSNCGSVSTCGDNRCTTCEGHDNCPGDCP